MIKTAPFYFLVSYVKIHLFRNILCCKRFDALLPAVSVFFICSTLDFQSGVVLFLVFVLVVIWTIDDFFLFVAGELSVFLQAVVL